MDVDGTMTDGSIYIGADGEVMKAFNVRDGYAIGTLLPQNGIVPVIITGRVSQIVEARAAELGIMELYQGRQDKAQTLRQVLEKYRCPGKNAAYIGDDVLDIPCMRLCGVSGCPSDADAEVAEQCDYICRATGGHGAVREFVEWILKAGGPERHRR